LQPVLLLERLLDRVQLAALLEPLDGHHLAPVRLHGEDGARLHRLAVEEHGAGAAVGRVAADVRAGEAQVLANEMDEQQPRLHLGALLGAVDADADLVRGHYLWPSSARWIALRSARAVSTCAIACL
jgi:hypothetical protein